MNQGIRLGAGVLLTVTAVGAGAQQASGAWTVRQDSVKAHEMFLASDALAGRGSATRDEAIAAEYVASEFERYGLTTAPGMGTYVQVAEVTGPALDGHARLIAGDLVLEEGKDFQLLVSQGGMVEGRLEKGISGGTRGGALLDDGPAAKDLKEVGRRLLGARQAGSAVLLEAEGPGVEALATQWGGGTRVPVRLKDAPGGERPRGVSVVALSSAAMEQMKGVAKGTAVRLEVHPAPNQPKRTTANAIGYLPGTDLSAGTVLLTAHLDHLGEGRAVNGDGIYNGANDDAAGTTAVLELAEALAAGPKLRRSVLFVCYGSEEVGELGSTYFGEHPPVPLKELVANLEFEMIGNQDPKMPAGVLLLTGWDRSNLGPELKKHGALLGPDPYPEQHFFERSDNYALALKGVVAHTAAGWGTVPTYHQPNDDLQHLDVPFMTRAIQSLVEPVRWLAGSDFRPEWKRGGQPKAQ